MKPSGLAGFKNKAALPAKPQEERVEKTQKRRKARGQGALVSLTVRLPREEWARVHQLALAENDTIQGLAIQGLSIIFERNGLPGIEVDE